jgi:hypothetical protein
MHHLEYEIDRNQFSMMALEEMVGKDSYARLVDLFVNALPLDQLDQLGFANVNHEIQGRPLPPIHTSKIIYVRLQARSRVFQQTSAGLFGKRRTLVVVKGT